MRWIAAVAVVLALGAGGWSVYQMREVSTLEAELTSVREARDQAVEARETAEARADRAETRVDQLEDEVADLREQLQLGAVELDEVRLQVAELMTANESLARDLQQAYSELEGARAAQRVTCTSRPDPLFGGTYTSCTSR